MCRGGGKLVKNWFSTQRSHFPTTQALLAVETMMFSLGQSSENSSGDWQPATPPETSPGLIQHQQREDTSAVANPETAGNRSPKIQLTFQHAAQSPVKGMGRNAFIQMQNTSLWSDRDPSPVLPKLLLKPAGRYKRTTHALFFFSLFFTTSINLVPL